MSEAAKIKPRIEKYLNGVIVDIACGDEKIVPNAIGVDGRALPAVDIVCDLNYIPTLLQSINRYFEKDTQVDVVFSSHYLEHCANQYDQILGWMALLKPGGHLILYLPDGNHYNNIENPEHMVDMKYEDFMFWFRRAWCGEGKDYKGNHLLKFFEIVEHGLDVGDNKYSFYIVAKKNL